MSASVRPDAPTLITDNPLDDQSDARELAHGSEPAAAEPPASIGGRYRVLRTLGRGGMAVVYLVEDAANGRMLALKQLVVPEGHRHYPEMAALFEREFHTLVQLSHPRIVEVYDFGLDRGPYYTMELLDGGDLRDRSPLPWRDASGLMHDVCSTLALLHSRRFVHRDVSPRNVRTTRDGLAKLIDFGALAPMGTSAQIVGTPPFVPPEVMHRSALDARTDLFSLGATFYFALTGRLAYPAREFAKLPEAWAARPPPPSSIVAEIPAALDALVMALIALDPAVRPRSAFEVMQRLSGIAGLARDETLEVSQAYLSMPVMVGRDEALGLVRGYIKHALTGRGSALLLSGNAGIGRSRMLDASALEAKTAGATVLRANARIADQSLGVVQALAAQLLEAAPESALAAAKAEKLFEALFDEAAEERKDGVPSLATPRLRELGVVELERAALQRAICAWFFRVSELHPLAILVDDLHKADEASLALLATLTRTLDPRRIALVMSHESNAAFRAPDPFAVLKRYCTALTLPSLSRSESEALFNSVFGDVPNLGLLNDRIFRVAKGNPRESMELAQFLVEKNLVRYEGGGWSLPNRLDLADLPHNLAEVLRARLSSLSPAARALSEAHALSAQPALSREQYARLLAQFGSQGVDDVISELIAQQVVTSEGLNYVLAHRGWSDALCAVLDANTRAERHRALAELYVDDGARRMEHVHHLLLGGCDEAGLDHLIAAVRSAQDNTALVRITTLSPHQVGEIIARGLDSAERLARNAAEAFELRRALAAISIASDDSHYFRVRPVWFERLKRDSGLGYFEALTQVEDRGARLMQALTHAAEVYNATPEIERVYSPELAIRSLVYYVLVSIALGTRTQECELLRSLPAALEPFTALSPVIAAIWKNALATCESNCDGQPERALAHWLEVETALAEADAQEMPWAASVRSAVTYGIGVVQARLGMACAEERARMLDQDVMQRVSAMSLRKIARLQQGDFDGAERYRKQGEALALQSHVRQMFSNTLGGELIAHAMASDLIGIRQSAEAIEPYAARYPGWLPYKHMAEGFFEQARGQLAAARAAFERGLALSEPDAREASRSFGAWPRLEAGYIEVLIGLGEPAQAKARGEHALALAAEHGMDNAAFPIRRALALAEGKLGEYAQASQRLETMAQALIALGVTGLELGATYEARARIAIWASDAAAIEEYGKLTAKQYRHGERSPLGARYERLMDEARRAGVQVLPQLTDFQTKLTTAFFSNQRSASVIVGEKMARADTREKRLACALQLLADSRSARAGHLYLNGDAGLELAASIGERAPARGQREFVRRYIASELETVDTATVLSKGDSIPSIVASQWLTPDGVGYHPALLMGELGGEKCCAGAVMLEIGERTATEVSALQAAEAVATYLLLAGDARPLKS